MPAIAVTVAVEDATVEGICFEYAQAVLKDVRRAGRLAGYVEATLDTNPGLAALGPILPLGTVVDLPEFVVSDKRTVVRLWD